MESSRGSPYEPLEQSERHFRLLRLRESDTCQTQCEMKTFSLLSDDLPPWKALSYRWGEEPPEFTVHLNGHPVPMRKGLHAFLAQMIVENRHDWYFIDALCIDQSNDLEKSCQVLKMGEIYQRAEEVVIWIVYEPCHEERNDVSSWAVYDVDEDSQDISSLSQAELTLVVSRNSYWSRLWILQEVLLAKRLTIRIGSGEVEWSDLLPKQLSESTGLPERNERFNEDALWQYRTSPGVNTLNGRNILSYRRFRTKALRAGYYLPFHKAFEFFSMQRCSRPHDAVFGYLGLTNSRIQVDYSTPILDLFMATLADYLLSLGFTKQESPINLIAKLLDVNFSLPVAFGLDLDEPVVHLLMLEVTKLLAPGLEDCLTNSMMFQFWLRKWHATRTQDVLRQYCSELNFESKNVALLWCQYVYVHRQTTSDDFKAAQEEIATRLKELEDEDAVMFAPGESGESKTYSQWAAHARAISEQIWQRFIESGEHTMDNMDDESWSLIHENNSPDNASCQVYWHKDLVPDFSAAFGHN